MSAEGGFALGRYMAHWRPLVRHDLSASECSPLSLSALLGMAKQDDRERWERLTLGYTDPDGAVWLRAAIAARHRGLREDNVLCCAGAQEALTCITQSLLAPGDHAIVAVPLYQPTEWALASCCVVTAVPLEQRGGWSLDLARVAAAIRPATKLLLVNFPNSPTGATIDADGLAGLVALCRQHGLWLVNDEVYRRTDADPHGPPRVAECYERGISIDAVSKGFGLPGLRVGWMVCQDTALLALASRTKSMLSSCVSAPSEVLAHVALAAEAQIIRRNRAVGQERLSQLRDVLAAHADLFEVQVSDNLAFACPRYRGADGADGFAASLARDAGVLVLPSGLWPSLLASVRTVAPAFGRAAARRASGFVSRRA